MSKRKTHGEFKLTSEFSDEKFKKYFRMTRNDFKEVHAMIASDLEDQGYGGHERISTEEKLAVFLRFVASGNSYRSIAYSSVTVSNAPNGRKDYLKYYNQGIFSYLEEHATYSLVGTYTGYMEKKCRRFPKHMANA